MENQKTTNNSVLEPSPYKVKLMCSYGGRIQPRPRDHQLSYVGGDTKILAVDRNIKFSDMATKLCSLCNCNLEFCVKYQLPGEDLDALVSLIDDDDVEHMMVEYDRMHKVGNKPARLRLFLFFPIRSAKSDLESPLNPDFLFGFDKEYNPNSTVTVTEDLLQLQIPGMSGAPENSGSDTEKHGVIGGGVVIPQISGSEARNSSLMVQRVVQQHTQGLREGHVTGGPYGNAVQIVYGVPVMASGYHHPGLGQFSAVQRVVSGGGGQYSGDHHHSAYNYVPAVPTVMVPDQKMMTSTADNTLSREIKG